MSKNNCYAIKKDSGIITKTWDECQRITKGTLYQFKGFKNLPEALEFLGNPKENIQFIGFSSIKQEPTEQNDNQICHHQDITEKQDDTFFGNKVLTIYTDGGCIPNPGGKGGIGIVILENGNIVKEIHKSYYPTTNNRMEVMAAIIALQTAGQNNVIHLISDSQYLVRTMNREYSMNKNTDLWNALKSEIHKQKSVTFLWTKGHANQKYNERCDELASEAIESDTYINDTGYTGGRAACSNHSQNTIPEEIGNKRKEIPVSDLNPECHIAIQHFLDLKKPSFKDYAVLKTYGQDTFSRMKEDELKSHIKSDITDIITNQFKEYKDAIKAMRWYMRGLSVEQAVHKVNVDTEISANAISSYYKK